MCVCVYSVCVCVCVCVCELLTSVCVCVCVCGRRELKLGQPPDLEANHVLLGMLTVSGVVYGMGVYGTNMQNEHVHLGTLLLCYLPTNSNTVSYM